VISELLAVAALAVVPAPAATGGVADQREHLRAAQTLWGQQHVRDYGFRLRVLCDCPSRGRATTVTVRAGRPTGATGFQRRLDTVPELFEAIRHALDDPAAGKVSVHYDKRCAFPRRASIDRIKLAIDDEIGWTMDHFRPLK
jgi:hypothetical protein